MIATKQMLLLLKDLRTTVYEEQSESHLLLALSNIRDFLEREPSLPKPLCDFSLLDKGEEATKYELLCLSKELLGDYNYSLFREDSFNR